MKRTLFASAAILAVLASAICAFGDIARPKPSPAEPRNVLYTGLTIVPEPGSTRARLQISQAALERIKNGSANNGGASSMVQNVLHSSTRTIMAGTFMFLAISFAGIWFARSSERRGHKTVAVVLLLASVLGIGTVIVRANAGLPANSDWWNLPQALKDHKPVSAGLTVEIVPGDDDIKLLMPVKK